jgi:hypothetical protein
MCIMLLITGIGSVVWGAPTQTKHSFAIYIGEGATRKAILTESELIEYDWSEHKMKAPVEVINRIPLFSASGLSFDLEVDGKHMYQGRFVSGLSSMSFNQPTILIEQVMKKEEVVTLTIDRSYHGEAQYLKGPDVRFDERIRLALLSLGKLKGTPTINPALTKAIGEILLESRKIVPGTTRAELLKTFTTEGGLSNAKQRTYAHRRCPYIKIDVEFKLADSNQGALDERATDTVSKVSRLYLDWTVLD